LWSFKGGGWKKMIETIEILMEMVYNSGYAVRLSRTQTLTGFAYSQNVRCNHEGTVRIKFKRAV